MSGYTTSTMNRPHRCEVTKSKHEEGYGSDSDKQ